MVGLLYAYCVGVFSSRKIEKATYHSVPFAKGVLGLLEDGDRVWVNIQTGEFANLTRGKKAQYEPLPHFLLEVIAEGGSREHLRRRLEKEGRLSP
jgi:hypothetical protein